MSRLALALAVLMSCVAVAPAEEPLAEKVRVSIERGVAFLRRQEQGRGNWEYSQVAGDSKPGGASALALLALLTAGVPADDPMIQRGLTYLRGIEPKYTYVVGLQTMVFGELHQPRDFAAIQRNVDWLIQTRVKSGDQMIGWTYDGSGNFPDNSNSQYALLGLHAGRLAGAKIDRGVWSAIRDFYESTQSANPRMLGGWGYHTIRGEPPTLTMTVAGLCGLQIVAMELNKNRQGLQPDGTATNCGRYDEDESIRKALDWLSALASDGSVQLRFQHQYPYYNAYGIERAGRLTGQRFIAGYDWYRDGCEYILRRQKEDGSWAGQSNLIGFTADVNTSLALLFLSKGRTPVLISKWAHGKGAGWNNKHYDAKNLVEFASKELFHHQPLAWQSYDARHITFRNNNDLLAEVGTLLQSPIVYMNGHESPAPTTDTQRDLLKKYIEEGGFVMAEACCGKQAFTDGFRKLMADMFPDNPLRPLPPEHPIWKSWAVVRPDFVPLEGIELGCKTVVVFSPKPLAGYWEENLTSEGRGKEAFRLAGNIIAYATGLEPPKPRLSLTDVPDESKERPARGFLKIAQLRHEGDWQPAPRAMRNLLRYLREKEKLDVDLFPEEMSFTNPELFQRKFLYLHGRGKFTASTAGLDNVRTALSAGGALLLSDACCGSATFDASFRDFARKLFPGKALEPIPPTDSLYSAAVNGTKIDSVRVRTGGPGAAFDNATPALEGIKIDGRWVVIYSKYDIGCALEKHTSGDCKGHDHDSALKLAGAAVLYMLKK